MDAARAESLVSFERSMSVTCQPIPYAMTSIAAAGTNAERCLPAAMPAASQTFHAQMTAGAAYHPVTPYQSDTSTEMTTLANTTAPR